MFMKMSWTEMDQFTGLAIRIFRNKAAMWEYIGAAEANGTDAPIVNFMEKALAVSQIRRQVYNKQDGRCMRCPALVTYRAAHLHEKIHRGEGGEISLENSEILCAECHLFGKGSAHGNRRPQFTKRT